MKKSEEQKRIEKEKAFENQIENYNNLGIMKSSRGQAVLAIMAISVISLLLAFFNVVTMSDVLFGLIIYIPLAYFIYKGHRWAIIGVMIMWTLDKGYQLISLEGKNLWSTVIWWVIIFMPLYEALRVENERRKRNKDKNINSPVSVDVQSTQEITSDKSFCSSCGNEFNGSSNFCKFCGKKLN